MIRSLLILGRQPSISLAELESVYGPENITQFGKSSAIVNFPASKIILNNLGGSIKLCEILTTIPSIDWKNISHHLSTLLPDLIHSLPEGKIKLGISTYDLSLSPKVINSEALKLKKLIQNLNRTVRIVPNNQPALNTAQVIFNKLTIEPGIELIIAGNSQNVIIAKTKDIQDINSYASRDRKRPKRDAKVGMLPPKLAQTIINLASQDYSQSILDPFCGTGVILQEAILMGHDVYGTDIEERMVEYSRVNLDWLNEQTSYNLNQQSYLLETGDACNFTWQSFDSIASETYLGRPFSSEPDPDQLKTIINNVNVIHRKFLQNISNQTKSGFKMCIAVPAWFTKYGIKHLPVLDHLTDMGYTRKSFAHAREKDLIYHRDNQIVGRELVILIRN